MRHISVRAVSAAGIFIAAVIGFQSGVRLSGGDAETYRTILVDAYYALSLFVIGGIDIGTPEGGPLWALMLLWFAYFAAPILAVTAILDLFLRVFSHDRWRLRRLKDHIVIEGDGEMCRSYLRRLRSQDPRRQVVVVCGDGFTDTARAQLQQFHDAMIWEGQLIDDFTFDQLRVKRAAKLLLFSPQSLRNFETVKAVLDRRPQLAGNIVMHSDRLRFMRSMNSTRVAKSVTIFNSYQNAAEALVDRIAAPHAMECCTQVGVVIAGFGRFGQSILESLQVKLPQQVSHVALIEHDAERRVMVTQEQVPISTDFELKVLPGDMSHPGVWHELNEFWDISQRNTLFMLATSREEDNLRTALWLRRQNSEALIVARLERSSSFAEEVAQDHNIIAMGLHQLIEEAIPDTWITSPG